MVEPERSAGHNHKGCYVIIALEKPARPPLREVRPRGRVRVCGSGGNVAVRGGGGVGGSEVVVAAPLVAAGYHSGHLSSPAAPSCKRRQAYAAGGGVITRGAKRRTIVSRVTLSNFNNRPHPSHTPNFQSDTHPH